MIHITSHNCLQSLKSNCSELPIGTSALNGSIPRVKPGSRSAEKTRKKLVPSSSLGNIKEQRRKMGFVCCSRWRALLCHPQQLTYPQWFDRLLPVWPAGDSLGNLGGVFLLHSTLTHGQGPQPKPRTQGKEQSGHARLSHLTKDTDICRHLLDKLQGHVHPYLEYP